MASFDEHYFAELEHELHALSKSERESILRELRSHTEDASADPQGDAWALQLGLPTRSQRVGRALRRIHASAQHEARKRRSMLAISTSVAILAIVLSFIWPWFVGNVLAFVLGGLAVVCAALSLIGVWVPKPRLGRWLVWSGSAGLTLIGMPPIISFGSIYLICGPLLLVTGTQLNRA